MANSLILRNGSIYPLNGIVPRVESISIDNGKILKMGQYERVRESLPDPDQEIDLEGRAVVPSFTDSLAQIGYEALMRATLDVSRMRMLPEIFALVEQRIKHVPAGEWVVGYGWNKSQWGWSRFPHRADLDLVSPHHPVALFSADHRVVWLNTQALQLVGVRHAIEAPPGGEIERDDVTGSATGILKETAVSLVLPFLPLPPSDELHRGFDAVFETYLRKGVAAAETFETFQGWQSLSLYSSESTFPIQVTCHVRYEDREELIASGLKTGAWMGGVRMGGVWIVADGTLSSQTARLLAPYADDWNKFGLTIRGAEEMFEAMEWCVDHGFTPIPVASGDAAVHDTLVALAELTKKRGPSTSVVVNGDLVHPQDWLPISRLHPVLCANPRRVESESEVGRVFWGDRWSGAINLNGWKTHGSPLSFGSGEPLSLWDPLECVHAAMHEKTGRDPHQVIPPEAAFAALARSVMQQLVDSDEGFLGTGRPADLVVLSHDPFQYSPAGNGERIQIEQVFHRGQNVDLGSVLTTPPGPGEG